MLTLSPHTLANLREAEPHILVNGDHRRGNGDHTNSFSTNNDSVCIDAPLMGENEAGSHCSQQGALLLLFVRTGKAYYQKTR